MQCRHAFEQDGYTSSVFTDSVSPILVVTDAEAAAAHGSGSHVSYCNHIYCLASTTNRNDFEFSEAL